MAVTYGAPAITLTAQGAAQPLIQGPTPNTLLFVGTASKGPDFPVLISTSQCSTMFGDPYAPASLGHTLPLGMLFANGQRQPVSNRPYQIMVCRIGVTRATVVATAFGAGTSFTLSGIGPYAGSAANSVLACVITAPQINVTRVTAGSATGPVNEVQLVSFVNTPTAGTFTLSFTNPAGTVSTLSAQTFSTMSAATLQTALNALASVSAGGGSVAVSGSNGAGYTVTFSGGGLAGTPQNLIVAPTAGQLLTGQASAPPLTNVAINASGVNLQNFPSTQYPLGTVAQIVAAINGANPLQNYTSVVLASSAGTTNVIPLQGTYTLSGGADGLGTAYSDASVATSLTNSLYTAVDYICPLFDANLITPTISAHITAALGVNQFRKAILGPKVGTTFGTLTSGTYQTAQSSRIVMIGHDGAYAVNPQNGQQTLYDGFYLACAYGGLKAIGPTEETCTTFPLTGFSQLGTPSDKTGPLAKADKDLLGSNGFLVLENPIGTSALVVRDAITTAPFNVNGSINPFYQFNVQCIDDAVSYALIAAVSPFKGRPALSLSAQLNQLQAACFSALGRLGTTINGVNSVVVNFDPSTLIPTVNVSYITRFPLILISIITNYTYV